MSKWNYGFRNVYELIKNKRLKCLEFNHFVVANLNKFRSKNVLNKSQNKLHGLTPWAIIVFTPSLYPTYAIICKVPQSSSEFQAQIQPQSPGRFFNVSKRRAPIGRCEKNI